ncbi:MAG TPA: hypothetical protein VGJ41_05450 [Nocardioides sp.]
MTGKLPYAWGTTQADLDRTYPADTVLDGPVVAMTRAVRVLAPAALAYRWLCQIREAPYSYDLIDNLGRRSPQQLTPGADQIEVGDRMMIFEVTDVQPGRQWTGRTLPGPTRIFGQTAATYAVEPVDDSSCVMVCRLTSAAGGWLGRFRGWLLGWGDLVMMRKQLLNLKGLAERDAGVLREV